MITDLLTAATAPEIDARSLLDEAEALHERERIALDALGAARLRGIPVPAEILEDLHRTRDALEVTYAAHRLAEASRPRRRRRP